VQALQHQARLYLQEGKDKDAKRYLLAATDLLEKSTLRHAQQQNLASQIGVDLAKLNGIQDEDSEADNSQQKKLDENGFPIDPNSD